MASVTIPDSVTSIGDYAFSGCSSLTSVYYKGNEESWTNISIGFYNHYLTSATRYYSESEPEENSDGTDYEAAMKALGKSANPPLQYGKINATDALIGKILLATLGCTVTYDSHARKVLGVLGSFDKLDDFYDKIIKGGQSVTTPVAKAFKMKYPALKYPVMKIIDMALWVYGI